MRFYLKKEVYFEVEIDNGSDRAVATAAFDEVVEPAFDKLISKIRFEESERDALRKLLGYKVSVVAMSKRDFLKTTNQRRNLEKESL